MTTTTSATLLPENIEKFDQTTFTESRTSYIDSSSRRQNDSNRFVQTILALAEGTDDGGVGLHADRQILTIVTIRQEITNNDSGLFRSLIKSIVPPSSFIHAWFIKQPHTIETVHPHLEAIRWIKEKTGFSQTRIGDLIGVSRQAINDWEKGYPIANQKRQRLLAVRDVLERASVRYPTRELLSAWLDTPRNSDGRTPAELLKANEINKVRLLAISAPSPHVKSVPSWVKQSTSEAFFARSERQQDAVPVNADDELIHFIRVNRQNLDEDGEDFSLHE